MADINNVISLGIGSPSSIKFFLRYGLGYLTVGDIDANLYERDIAGSLEARDLSSNLYARDLAGSLAARDIAVTLHERDDDGALRNRP